MAPETAPEKKKQDHNEDIIQHNDGRSENVHQRQAGVPHYQVRHLRDPFVELDPNITQYQHDLITGTIRLL
jgi:hypothetical protein